MKFKFTLLITLLSIIGFAQDLASLKSESQKMLDYSISLDFEKMMDFTYPKVFDIASKDQMLEMMTNMFENDQMSIKLEKIDPKFSFGEIKKIDKQVFCKFSHDNKMKLSFKTDIAGSEEMIVDMLKENTGASDVTYDDKTKSFYATLRVDVLAVADDSTKNIWKFITLEKDKAMLSMLLSEDIIKQLGLN
jgi:hypothetical protein